MFILGIIVLVIWFVVGLLELIPTEKEITKGEYFLAWLVLMCQLLQNILCG